MQTIKKKAFTLIELLVVFAILFVIVGIIILTMTRGASNVQKGSFNALAANQAFWIVSVIRSDISRSIGSIEVEFDSENTWKGDTEFKINIEGGTVTYSIEKSGNKKTFVRKFSPSNSETAFAVSDSKKQTFGDEYLTDMTVSLSDNKSYVINIMMTDSNKSTPGIHEYTTTSTIYPPQNFALNHYWVSTLNN